MATALGTGQRLVRWTVDIHPSLVSVDGRETTWANVKCAGTTNDKAFVIRAADGSEHTFDNFGCAVYLLAPRCEHCDSMIIGHAEEVDGRMFSSALCARLLQPQRATHDTPRRF